MTCQQYCLKWNNYQANFQRVLTRLLRNELFTDVTLACEGFAFQAHKLVLSVCSSYFEHLFTLHREKSPLVILKDTKCEDMKDIIEFMYNGEVNVPQDRLPSLLHTANSLKIKGLTEASESDSNIATDRSSQNIQFYCSQSSVACNDVAQTKCFGTPSFVTSASQSLTCGFFPIAAKPSTSLYAVTSSHSINSPSLISNTTHHSHKIDKDIKHDVETSTKQLVVTCPLVRMLNQQVYTRTTPVFNTSPSVHCISHQHKSSSHSQPGSISSLVMSKSSVDCKSLAMHDTVTSPRPSSPLSGPFDFSHTSDSFPIHSNQTLPNTSKITSIESSKQNKPVPEDLHNTPKLEEFMANTSLGRDEFWRLDSTAAILLSIKDRRIDVKMASELLGVSYNTVYGRYRDCYGLVSDNLEHLVRTNTSSNNAESDHLSVPATSLVSSSSTSSTNGDIIQMNAFVNSGGTRSAFWELDSTKHVLEMIHKRAIELKHATKQLGVSYGTLYGHYRETYGLLKSNWKQCNGKRTLTNNATTKLPLSISSNDDFMISEISSRIRSGDINIQEAAQQLNIDVSLLQCWLSCYTNEDIEEDVYPSTSLQPVSSLSALHTVTNASTIAVTRHDEDVNQKRPRMIYDFLSESIENKSTVSLYKTYDDQEMEDEIDIKEAEDENEALALCIVSSAEDDCNV